VTAYRALPEILDVVREDRRFGPIETTRILAKTNDTALSRGRGGEEGAAIHLLSPREVEVSELLVRGMSNREIAAALCISEVTAKVHMRHIFEKLGARSRTQAALLLAESSPKRD
jgi:DNA-binding NarL/FixJ family response regulator